MATGPGNTQRPDSPLEWVENRLESARVAIADNERTLKHGSTAVLKADIQALKEQTEALVDIVRMLAVETAALRDQSAPPR